MRLGLSCGFSKHLARQGLKSNDESYNSTTSPWPAAAGIVRYASLFIELLTLLAHILGNPQLWPQIILIIHYFGLTSSATWCMNKGRGTHVVKSVLCGFTLSNDEELGDPMCLRVPPCLPSRQA